MHGSDRGERNPDLGAFGVLSAITLCCVIVGLLAYLSGRESQRREQTPAAYSAAARTDAQRACAGDEPAAVFECVYEKVEASQEQARGEQDLSAQQRAATSALAAAVVAFITFLVTGLGVWFVKRTLDATLKAVEDTSKATDAMRKANEIALNGQRAWIALRMQPILFRPSGTGIYFRMNFIAENVGQTAATHFDMRNEIFFLGQTESAEQVGERIERQIEEWKADQCAQPHWVLIPGDSESDPWWGSQTNPEFEWLDGPMPGGKMTKPIFVSAAFYRTTSEPEVNQVVWRSWYLNSRDEGGHITSWLTDVKHGAEALCAEPFRTSSIHEKFGLPYGGE